MARFLFNRFSIAFIALPCDCGLYPSGNKLRLARVAEFENDNVITCGFNNGIIACVLAWDNGPTITSALVLLAWAYASVAPSGVLFVSKKRNCVVFER